MPGHMGGGNGGGGGGGGLPPQPHHHPLPPGPMNLPPGGTYSYCDSGTASCKGAMVN